MEEKLEMMTKWLRDSGLVVNDEKTEICLFYKHDHPTIELRLYNKTVKSKSSINVLGVIFDSKLQWINQVAQVITKSKQALHAIRIVSKYMNKLEIKQLLTSNFFSILYYNCEIWLMPSLSPALKQHLLAASAWALKLLGNRNDLMISYDDLHKFHKRATPTNVMKYRLSIQLFKIMNGENQNDDWVDLNFQQNFNARVDFIQIFDTSRLKIGKNIIMNIMSILSRLIKFDWLNLSLNSFKIKMKQLFMTN